MPRIRTLHPLEPGGLKKLVTWRGGWTWAFAGLVVAVVAAGLVVSQAQQAERSMVLSAHRVLERTFGPTVSVDGEVEARLLPRPRLLLRAVSLADGGSGLRLDAPLVEATPTLASILLGRADFEQIRLVEPTASVDVDRLASPGASLEFLRHLLPDKVVIVSGVVALRSANPAASGLIDGLDAALEGVDRNGPAVLSGHATWRGQRTEVTARLEPFLDFMIGRPASGSLHLRLPALSAAIDGKLHAGVHGGFEGSVTASTPSLETLLRANGLPPRLGTLVGRASFSASGLAGPDAITFSNTRLTLDDTRLEGSLAWQPNGGRGAWTGTFATDVLDLTRPLHGLAAWDRDGRWSDARIAADSALWGDIDLRVSAGEATFGTVSLEDAAFSASCRDGRIEVGLSEARASDGMVRGRAVMSLQPTGVDLKVDVSMAQLDLEPLGWSRAAGIASGHLTARARGDSPRTLVADLAGRGQVSVRQGSLPTLGDVADLSSVTGAPLVRSAWDTPVAFDLGTADLLIEHGVVSIASGRLVDTSSEHRFEGHASLLDRSFSLAATEIVLQGPGAGREAVANSLDGVWGRPVRILHMNQVSAPAGLATPRPVAADLMP